MIIIIIKTTINMGEYYWKLKVEKNGKNGKKWKKWKKMEKMEKFFDIYFNLK